METKSWRLKVMHCRCKGVVHCLRGFVDWSFCMWVGAQSMARVLAAQLFV